jgi:MoaA/NifB/PqqE/SkfB family radical SAM enzyme
MRPKESIENLFSKGKHFCVLPWVHLHVTGLGYMAPCCLQTEGPDSTGYGSLNVKSFPELWQGKAIRDFRLKMLADEMDQHCVNCYQDETVNKISLRVRSNNTYRKHLDWVAETDPAGYAPQAKPVYWDLRFSNQCNLKCRTCNSSSSSSWYPDEKALGKLDANKTGAIVNGIKNTAAFLMDLEPYYRSVEGIYFAGGEPLLFKENLSILKKLDSIQKYETLLIYNTNLTPLNKKLIFPELWKKFPKLLVLVSLDGSSQRGEYLRKGLVWGDILNNLRLLKKECPHADLGVNFTVSAFNILHLPGFHREMVEKRHLEINQIYLNILHTPGFYNVKILPEQLKQQATAKINDHISWLLRHESPARVKNKEYSIEDNNFIEQWHACINFMNSESRTHLLPEFVEYTQKLDNLRNEKCLDVFPELEPIFNRKK